MKRKCTYRLEPGVIARARKILGTPSDTATIEQALDLVIFGEELSRWGRRVRKKKLDLIDPEDAEHA